MVFSTELGKDFSEVLKYGNRVRFRYFTPTYVGSYYDDELTLAQSGSDLWISGVLQPLDGENGSSDSILLAQGRILKNDRKLYVAGSINTSGLFRVGVGSPPSLEYAPVPDGIISWEVEGVNIYKKIYIRVLPTGSLAEE